MAIGILRVTLTLCKIADMVQRIPLVYVVDGVEGVAPEKKTFVRERAYDELCVPK